MSDNQIFIGNLHFEVTWQDLKDLFSECGNNSSEQRLYHNAHFGSLFCAPQSRQSSTLRKSSLADYIP